MAMALSCNHALSSGITPPLHLHRFFSQSKQYISKVSIPEFMGGIGTGVEAHVEKLEKEIGDFQKLLVTRTLKLKKLEIPCKHRKLILSIRPQVQIGTLEATS